MSRKRPAQPADDAGVRPDIDGDVRLKRALLAHVRQDFSAPVAAIVGYADILIEDAPHRGLAHCKRDLTKIRRAGIALQKLIDGLLSPQSLRKRVVDDDYEAFSSKLRHDLRTPMTAIKGYGEMLLEDAQEAGVETFAADLEKILAAATRLLARIDTLVEFSGDGRSAVDDKIFGNAALDRISPVPVVAATMPVVGSRRILVVDDHQSNRDLLSRRLSREGYEVATAADGRAALEQVAAGNVDLVLLDLLMPGMSGYEVLCRLKADPQHGETPVIMISALDELESVIRCIDVGAEDYLPKPFEPVLLRARINSCLEKKWLRDREKIILEELRNEKEKSELLLLNILPRSIISRLHQGEKIIADRIPDVSILFADMVGFTKMATRMPASDLVNRLNRLFTAFDKLSVRFGLEKIKTIGDAYMVAGGVPEPHDDHAGAIADMALAMLDTANQEAQQSDGGLQIRIGIHSGPVVAGVIGTQKFVYDMWGDTVNLASRLESHGTPGKIKVSHETYRRLRPAFEFGDRQIIDLKGSGPAETYTLVGRRVSGTN